MKTFALLVWAGLAAGSFAQMANAQDAKIRKTAAPTATSSDREQDGLNGPVRRVRIETAKIFVKDGKPLEGSRAVRGITTYDISGRKIDTVAHPVESSAPLGKEQYRYDDNGNIIEMVVRSDDGSVLSKEVYQYEFDELGNWKKMNTSVAVYEDGKVNFEPVEITYRTITYYYGQAIDKIASAPASKPSESSAPESTVSSNHSSASQTTEAVPPNESKANTAEKMIMPIVGPATDNMTAARSIPGKTAAPSDSVGKPSGPAAEIAVTHLSEEALRKAAIDLPQPEFPLAAELTGQKASVEVQVAVDEKGNVTSARGTSGNLLLNEAAEAAALKARFSPSRLSTEPARVFGVITYEFAAPGNASPLVVSTLVTQESGISATPNVEAPKPTDTAAPATNSVATPVAPIVSPAEAASQFYAQGLAHLKAGRHTEAVEALRLAVDRNPEDAMAYVKLGVAYSALQQYKETVAVFKLAIRLKAQAMDAEAYFRLGEAQTYLGKHADALKAFRQALSIIRAQAVESDLSKYTGFPSIAQLHYGLGLAYNNLYSYRDAIKEMQQAIALRPDFAEAHYGIAIAYVALNDRKSAEREEKILRPLNAHLANKLAAAINTSPVLPPGHTAAGVRRP